MEVKSQQLRTALETIATNIKAGKKDSLDADLKNLGINIKNIYIKNGEVQVSRTGLSAWFAEKFGDGRRGGEALKQGMFNAGISVQLADAALGRISAEVTTLGKLGKDLETAKLETDISLMKGELTALKSQKATAQSELKKLENQGHFIDDFTVYKDKKINVSEFAKKYSDIENAQVVFKNVIEAKHPDLPSGWQDSLSLLPHRCKALVVLEKLSNASTPDELNQFKNELVDLAKINPQPGERTAPIDKIDHTLGQFLATAPESEPTTFESDRNNLGRALILMMKAADARVETESFSDQTQIFQQIWKQAYGEYDGSLPQLGKNGHEIGSFDLKQSIAEYKLKLDNDIKSLGEPLQAGYHKGNSNHFNVNESKRTNARLVGEQSNHISDLESKIKTMDQKIKDLSTEVFKNTHGNASNVTGAYVEAPKPKDLRGLLEY